MDELVRQYLVKRGFASAALELDKVLAPREDEVRSKRIAEINVTSRYLVESEDGDSAASGVLTTEELIVWGLNSGDVSMYNKNYDLFHSWAYGSLDLIKNELISLCFPLFTISYISLIRKGRGDAARQFWNSFANDHKDWFGAELRALTMLTTSEQLRDENFLKSYPFVHHAHKRKFKVSLSNMVVNLLTTFLSQNDLLLIAAMVNENIHIDRSNLLLPSDNIVRAELEGYNTADSVTQISYQPVTLDVPGSGLGGHEAWNVGDGSSRIIPDFRSDELYQKWLKNILLRKIFASSSSSSCSGQNYASSSTRQDKTGSGQGGRLSSGDPLEPSIIFATFTNINDSIICLDIDSEVKQAAAGFRDSSVRVWKLSDGGEGGNGAGREEGVEWEYSKIIPWSDPSTSSSAVAATAAVVAAPGGSSSGPPFQSAGSNIAQHTSSHTPHTTSVPQQRHSFNDNTPSIIELRGHSRPVYGISQNQACSGNPSLVLSSSADCSIRLWDVAKRQCVAKYTCLMPSWDVAFSPVDYYFASANMDRTLTLFSTDRLEPIRIMTDHNSDVTCCKWHQNATLIASGSDDKTARLWDARSGGSVRVFIGSHSAISCVVVSPSGSMLAAGSDSGAIMLWDIATCTQMAVLRGHDGPVHSVAFSKDGTAIVSGGADCSVKIWDIGSAMSVVDRASTIGGRAYLGTAPGTGESLLKLQPVKCFHTKLSPVYFVDYSRENFVFAGGPFSPHV